MQAVGDHGVLDAFFCLYTSKWIRNLGDISVNIHESLWKLFGFSKFGTCWNFEIGFKVKWFSKLISWTHFSTPQSKLDNCCVLGEPLKPNIPLVNQKKSEEKMWFFAHISSRKSNPQMSHNFHFETPLFSNQETGKAKNPSFLARANSAQPLRFFLRDVFFPSPSFGGPQKIKPPGRGLNRKKKNVDEDRLCQHGSLRKENKEFREVLRPPVVFVDWFEKPSFFCNLSYYILRSLSSSKRNPTFENGGWLPNEEFQVWNGKITLPTQWFLTFKWVNSPLHPIFFLFQPIWKIQQLLGCTVGSQ